ncbi:NLI interacting factor-like phosphatase family protein [Trichomonas vaginalis G3]|uniref:protein-serine/threonine phosphatase n=1 Tax=Trichomonas vaginalis (strain ATCC PRA-98 / G3) TaxID=412133 RepID=A2DY00_TRIV3|nr:RNA polymerase II CTD heptapeptide repeat phosphatase protein [Trichomonas vaginalis G3]EAY14736.1 NLI interacting factor-like phosphatase family protein [Trichomonas vaginalis G3]KAI5487893.1 RNA polymerase II CTD heptapeptide repeat phosphatase protein [Trichomonas vaginalis G3]|eukprot:XP_001326959.1 NLI interacting factor-like phosphatase family protein [Trichomonas vaginalis G3]
MQAETPISVPSKQENPVDEKGSSPCLSPKSGLVISYNEANDIQASNKQQYQENSVLGITIRLEKVLLDIMHADSTADFDSKISNAYRDMFIKIEEPTPTLIRLRPGIDNFLKSITEHFKIVLISGLDQYIINEVVKRLDPMHTYFGNRIYRDQDFDFKNDENNYYLFPPSSDLTVILDTSRDHWKNDNGFTFSGFVFVCPYNYFQPSTIINVSEDIALPLVSKLDSVLFGLSRYLEQIHLFYYVKKVDSIVLSIGFAQHPILKGCYICIPDLSPEEAKNFDILIARFGGKFMPSYDSAATHLVISSKDSPAIAQASQYNGVYITTIGWIVDTFTHYEKKDERNYPLIGVDSPTHGPNPIEQYTGESSTDISSGDIDYEDSSDSYSDEEMTREYLEFY